MSEPTKPFPAQEPPPDPSGKRGLREGVQPFDLGRLVQQRQAEVWRYLRFLGASAAEADDLTQETFLAVARSRFVEQSDEQTAGYLRTVAQRQLLMLRRKQKRRITTVELESAESVWAESMWPKGTQSDRFDDRVEAARGCVEKLDGRPKQAIDLSYRQGSSREAIAEALGMTADGVKTLLRRTREKLRECIERQLGEKNSKGEPAT